MCDGYFNCPDFTDEIFCPRKLLFATSIYYMLSLFVVLSLLLFSFGFFMDLSSYLVSGMALGVYHNFFAPNP